MARRPEREQERDLPWFRPAAAGVSAILGRVMLSLATGRLADVAVISTQDRDHAGPALSALEHGYHLLLEKPAASTLDECRAILATARAQDRRVILCYVLRHTPFYRTVREFVDSGKLGDLITIHATEGV